MFRGTGTITKLLFRQQRFKILIWLVSLIVVTLAAASSYPELYPDAQAKQAFAMTMQNPAMVAMVGVGYAINEYTTIGALFAHEMLLFSAIAVAVMNILLVVKSTRADEEDGRTEMVRALPVGRLSYLNATMILMALINLILAGLIGIGLYALGIDGIGQEGSFLYGALLGGTGLLFACLTAMFAQLNETSRGTSMYSFTALILFYLIRGIGDVSQEWLSLMVPLGWTVRAEVFVANQWWPVYLSIGIALVVSVITFYLNSIRDLEAGFIAVKAGRSHASSFLLKPAGFILRQQRTSILAWSVIIFAFSTSFGFIMGDLETYFTDLEIMEAFLADLPGTSMSDQFVAMVIAIMSLISVVPAGITMLHLKGEESKNRTENFYSRAISRTRLLSNYLLVSIVVSIILQALLAAGLWLVSAAVMDVAFDFGTIMASVLVYLPAMWIVVGLAVWLIGIRPKATGLVWFYLTYGFIVLYLGELLNFPAWATNLSAFVHVPELLIEDMEPLKLAIMMGIAVVLMVVGFIGYNRRDLEG